MFPAARKTTESAKPSGKRRSRSCTSLTFNNAIALLERLFIKDTSNSPEDAKLTDTFPRPIVDKFSNANWISTAEVLAPSGAVVADPKDSAK